MTFRSRVRDRCFYIPYRLLLSADPPTVQSCLFRLNPLLLQFDIPSSRSLLPMLDFCPTGDRQNRAEVDGTMKDGELIHPLTLYLSSF